MSRLRPSTAGAPRTKILEDRLRRAKALLSKIQAQSPSLQLNLEISNIFESPPGSPSPGSDTSDPADDSSGDQLENMLDGRGRLTSTKNSTEYYGGGSGFAFLQRTQELFSPETSSHSQAATGHVGLDVISRLFESPLPDKQALASDIPFSQLLPSRQTATELLDVAFGQTYQLLQFLDEPDFQRQTDRIYELDPIEFADSDHDFLPLFYAVTAIGYLFDRKMHEKYGCKGAVNQAMRHFIAARRMVNLDHCTDIVSLQTLLCFILFLMSTARLANAHTYLGLAVAAAMRMGLHTRTCSTPENLSELEKDVRRRVFWTIVKLDIYSGTVLGLPGMINLDYVDQIKPSGHIKDYADETQGECTSLRTRRTFAASAQYLNALRIMSKVTQKLYPKTDEEAHRAGEAKKIYVSNANILEIEEDFRVWRDGLPDALGSDDEDDSLSSVVYELEMVHNFGHMILYRPFLHYLARTTVNQPPDQRLLRCAMSCVRISRNTISRSAEMLRGGFLAPAAWQSVYTIFLSLVSLIFFLATQHGNPECEAIQKESEEGIRILAKTACQDIGSRRCLDVVRVLTRRLSHIIDLDVDNVCKTVLPLCKYLGPAGDRGAPMEGQTQVSPPVQAEKPNPSTARDRAGKRGTLPSHPQRGGHPPQSYRPQSTPLPPHPVNVPVYQHMHYAAPTPMWESSTGTPNPGHNQYLPSQSFAYGMTPPVPSLKSEGSERYGSAQMEVPYAQGFAWPFALSGENLGTRHGSGTCSHPPPMNHPLTEQDIAAFMRINPGEEPFL
ncbi:Gypsy retrotransposon integrase-like protein 1 [Exophiala xenobiotica]|nr:Gypsy retrotransposon integrase-like protein 1 [Exophiala xenobiotica]KAK5340036.1 Gypsy retrotransposon integrase-like protein 1 [Exophiala xenobiotica]KAK5381937.1 Gypsy retrotransposon integrase-like protein 1 [Exophiala xenobiotica]KAK5394413.1 Gypsy retrotransposon integrase-like protein 1 [Exophiala xenobiotica]KAK5423550.1 Gypsy retrotransposon integrase-like protein 1 [Exophiala xenobiotica]